MEKLQELLKEIEKELNLEIIDYIDFDVLDRKNLFDSIYNMLLDKNALEINFIGYSRSANYLAEKDPSFTLSLELAKNLGYTIDNINSEILASLLATDILQEKFREYEKEINSIEL